MSGGALQATPLSPGFGSSKDGSTSLEESLSFVTAEPLRPVPAPAALGRAALLRGYLFRGFKGILVRRRTSRGLLTHLFGV